MQDAVEHARKHPDTTHVMRCKLACAVIWANPAADGAGDGDRAEAGSEGRGEEGRSGRSAAIGPRGRPGGELLAPSAGAASGSWSSAPGSSGYLRAQRGEYGRTDVRSEACWLFS